MQMVDLDLFFRYIKRRDRGNQFGEKMANSPSFVALEFRDKLVYCYLNERINNINDAYISCKSFLNFGLVIP